MKKQDTCLFLAPWRNPAISRPHPTKPSVCLYPVKWPAMPNTYRPDRSPAPLYPKDCEGCPFFTKRGLVQAMPCEQTTIAFTDTTKEGEPQ